MQIGFQMYFAYGSHVKAVKVVIGWYVWAPPPFSRNSARNYAAHAHWLALLRLYLHQPIIVTYRYRNRRYRKLIA